MGSHLLERTVPRAIAMIVMAKGVSFKLTRHARRCVRSRKKEWRLALGRWKGCALAHEREVLAIGIGHGSQEVVAGDRLTVMSVEVQVHALPEPVLAQQRLVCNVSEAWWAKHRGNNTAAQSENMIHDSGNTQQACWNECILMPEWLRMCSRDQQQHMKSEAPDT